MKTKPLTGKERLELCLNHETTDRIPIGMLCGGINPYAKSQFDAYMKKKRNISADTYIDSFLDIAELWSFDIIPEKEKKIDVFGVERRKVSYGMGFYEEIAHFPLRDAASLQPLKSYSWPDTGNFDYSLVQGLINEKVPDKNKAIILGVANPFETVWSIRGFDQIFMDMMMNPEMVHYLMDKVTNFFIDHFQQFIHAAKGEIQYAFTADDVAGQDGLLFSNDFYSEFLLPYHTKLHEALHHAGVKIFYHSCGSVTNMVKDIQESGIDALQSLQFNAKNMNPSYLKEHFGKTLCFEGGMCVQKILPFGPTDEVVLSAENLIKVLGANGGYVFGPSHYIQDGTPPENIEAMFETALHYYPY